MRTKKKSPAHTGKRNYTPKHTKNAVFQDALPLRLRPGGQGCNGCEADIATKRPTLWSASALMPQIKAGRNTSLSIDAGGTL